MKVSIYALHLGFGGVERYVSMIASILAQEHEVEIVSTYRTTKQPAFPIDERVKITYLLPQDLPNNAAFKAAVEQKSPLKILKEGIYACKVLYLRHKKNKEFIKKDTSDVMLSTRIFHNRLIGKYANSNTIKITGEHNHPHGNESYIKKVVDSCKGFDYFIPISKELCRLYEGKLEPTTKILYLPFCIEESGVHTHEFPAQLRLINVGRLSAEKGCKDLIQVMNRLVHEEKLSVTLDVIGSGELEEEMKKEIAASHLQEAVTLHGFQKKNYIYEQYKNSSLYLMTSYTESFGIVLLEAMSCGVPCMAFDSAEGAREIIEDGKDGILISNRNIEEMCKRIVELADHRDELEGMSAFAFAKADQYSYRVCEKNWLHLFHKFQENC